MHLRDEDVWGAAGTRGVFIAPQGGFELYSRFSSRPSRVARIANSNTIGQPAQTPPTISPQEPCG